jgi:hypothetical protein
MFTVYPSKTTGEPLLFNKTKQRRGQPRLQPPLWSCWVGGVSMARCRFGGPWSQDSGWWLQRELLLAAGPACRAPGGQALSSAALSLFLGLLSRRLGCGKIEEQAADGRSLPRLCGRAVAPPVGERGLVHALVSFSNSWSLTRLPPQVC